MSEDAVERDIPGPNELYCPHCGEVTARGGVICGHCGGPLDNDAQARTPPAKWQNWGEIAAGLSYFLTPLVSPIAFYCGLKLRRYDEEKGTKIIGQALGSVVLWAIIVMLFL